MSDKQRYPRAAALAVADELTAILQPRCERLMVAGSLRRGKEEVGDVEILFLPKYESGGLFGDVKTDQTVRTIEDMLIARVIAQRTNVRGHKTWGSVNRLAVHCKSGIPVDLFTVADPECWWNAVVVRTGGKENNLLITTTALKMGWAFEAYGSGFKQCSTGRYHVSTSERDIYDFLGLPYLEPHERK